MLKKHFIIILMTVLGVFLINGCATLPKNFDRSESYALTDTKNTAFGKARAKERAAHPGKSGFHLLSNGLDAFVARAVLSHYAERSIDVQYYLYHNDLVGRLFTDLLLKAADRGVRVRLLVDDMDLAGRDLGATALDSHPNMEVRIFNPFSRNVGRTSQFVTRLGSVTRRMHNKTFTVDNQVSILGGRNIGNEYFDADPDLAFADLDVMAIVHAGYSKYRKDLLRGGVELYEMNKKLTRKERKEKKGLDGSSKASLHTKSFVFDRNKIFIGSLNLDPRAVVHNTEIGVVVSSVEIAAEMSDWFDQNIKKISFRLELKKNENRTEQLLWHGVVDGKELTFDVDPYTGFWRRFGIGFMSLLPIESQL